jgi:O-antigen ligase
VLSALWLRPASRGRVLRVAPVIGLLALATLSLAWSPDASYGGLKLGLWLLTGILPCVAMLALVSRDRPVGWRVVAGAAFVYTVVLLAIGNTTFYPGRIVFFESNPIWVARAVVVGALVVLFGPVPRWAKVLMLPPMLVAGYMTDSLGPTLGLVVGTAAGFAELIRTSGMSRPRVRLSWATLAVGTAVAATVAVAVVSSASSATLAPILDDPDVTSRAVYLDLAGQLFAGAPLLGSGIGAFAALGVADPYPHNMFAEIGSELGIAGVLLLLAWIGVAVRGALGSPLVLALVIGTTVFALFSGSIAGNAEFWICTGVGAAMYPVRRRADQPALATAT